MDPQKQERLKTIPKVDAILEHETIRGWLEAQSREVVVDEIRAATEELRASIQSSSNPEHPPEEYVDHIAQQVDTRLRRREIRSLRPVINATGIVVHTNLGRAPLSAEAAAGQFRAMNYSNLEFDMETGKRGSRYTHVSSLIRDVTGAEDAIVVNNNAAAVMLAVNSVSDNREIIISRGELVEIGGSFRIPDVITRSGGKLVEVGTTNKTRIDDYANSITSNTAALLKVHPSNFQIFGFTSATSREELVALGQERGIPVIEDLGSGTLVDLADFGLPHEDTVQEVIEAGVDLVTFSGDKLLGGPQAGIIAGKREQIDLLKRNPLLRALRINKQSLAVLEETLRIYRDAKRPEEKVPVLAMLTQSLETLAARAEALTSQLHSIDSVTVTIEDDHGYSGGGALPDKRIPTKVVAVTVKGISADALSARMRQWGVVGRIRDDRYILDMRTVGDDDLLQVVESLRHCV